MITIRTAAPEELPQLRDLWRKCFGDPGAYVDIFFQKFCSIDQVLVVDDDGEVDSMAAMLPGAVIIADDRLRTLSEALKGKQCKLHNTCQNRHRAYCHISSVTL